MELVNWRIELEAEVEVENWSCKVGVGELKMESCSWKVGHDSWS